MDGMDNIHDGHAWCSTKTTNIQNDFGLSFKQSSCSRYLECPNELCDYLCMNGSARNSNEWSGSTLIL